MRTAIAVLALVLAATGCVTDEPAESEISSELTFSYSAPKLEFLARLATMRRAADDLRAVRAATKLPASYTWTVYQQYRSLTVFLEDSAESLDTTADDFETSADAAIQEAAKISVYEDVAELMARMQAKMDDDLRSGQYEKSPYKYQSSSASDILDRLLR